MPRPTPTSVGAEGPRAAEPTVPAECSPQWSSRFAHGQYVPTLTAEAAWRVNAAVSKAAWWPWPFDLESVRVTCDVGYLYGYFSLPRPFCYRSLVRRVFVRNVVVQIPKFDVKSNPKPNQGLTLALTLTETLIILTLTLYFSDKWPFGQVNCYHVGYLYDYFSLPRLLCSRLRPDVHDRQTEVRQTSESIIL